MRSALWKFVAKVGHWTVQALVVVALVALLVLGLGPRTGRYQVATVLSASMRPTMPEGSMAFITPIAARDIRVGDVITYQIPVEDRRVVSHRVVEILEGGVHPVIRTKGDANTAPDPWTARMAGGPLWKVRAAVPKVGYPVKALRTPVAGRICVLVLPLVLCLLWLSEIWLPRPRPRSQGPATIPVALSASAAER